MNHLAAGCLDMYDAFVHMPNAKISGGRSPKTGPVQGPCFSTAGTRVKNAIRKRRLRQKAAQSDPWRKFHFAKQSTAISMIEQFRILSERWATLSPEERRRQVEVIANNEIRKICELSIEVISSDKLDSPGFSGRRKCVIFPASWFDARGELDDGWLAKFAGHAVHELLHFEQALIAISLENDKGAYSLNAHERLLAAGKSRDAPRVDSRVYLATQQNMATYGGSGLVTQLAVALSNIILPMSPEGMNASLATILDSTKEEYVSLRACIAHAYANLPKEKPAWAAQGRTEALVGEIEENDWEDEEVEEVAPDELAASALFTRDQPTAKFPPPAPYSPGLSSQCRQGQQDYFDSVHRELSHVVFDIIYSWEPDGPANLRLITSKLKAFFVKTGCGNLAQIVSDEEGAITSPSTLRLNRASLQERVFPLKIGKSINDFVLGQAARLYQPVTAWTDRSYFVIQNSEGLLERLERIQNPLWTEIVAEMRLRMRIYMDAVAELRANMKQLYKTPWAAMS